MVSSQGFRRGHVFRRARARLLAGSILLLSSLQVTAQPLSGESEAAPATPPAVSLSPQIEGTASAGPDVGPAVPTVTEADRGKMTEVLLEEAGQAYQQGDYARAVALYELMIERGLRNGHLYYNLGNSWQRLGQTGRAIHNYRRAELYLPRDGDVEANLAYARARTRDRIEPFEESGARRIFFWHGAVSDFELFWAAVALNAVFWGALAVRWVKRAPALRLVLVLSGAGALLSLGSLAARAWQYAYAPEAVVLEQEISVRSGTDVSSVRLFLLHAGSEVRTRQQSGGWVQIELPGNKRGWIEAKFVGLVKP